MRAPTHSPPSLISDLLRPLKPHRPAVSRASPFEMAEKRGRGRPAHCNATEPAMVVLDGPEPDASATLPAMVVLDGPEPDASPSEPQLARLRLRQRWELASVLNFLLVFKELIDLEISAEEIETALIRLNDDLAQIHINLLKGIPPVTKKLIDADAWVTVVCKKLATWWTWVAEGDNPLKVDHGEEIARYRELDPTARLMILKALCEVRALQDDILRYITDALKNGTPITAFRKEGIGGDNDGIIYWYDGDPEFGYRLYREVTRVESKQKLKGKGRPAQSTVESLWETLATNLEEFREISDNLSSGKIMAEAAIGEIIKTVIVPVLEEPQKKKERALKRKQRQALLLDRFLNSSRFGARQSQRERRPVKYTFDDYDQSIEEAIQVSNYDKFLEKAIRISKRSKTTRSPNKDDDKHVEHGPGHQDTVLAGSMDSDKDNSFPNEVHGSPLEVVDDDEHYGRAGDVDNVVGDYNEKDDRDSSGADDHDENESLGKANEEKDGLLRQTHSGAARNQKDVKAKVVVGLRRSRRTAGFTDGTDFGSFRSEGKGHAETKKRLRQRPTRNADYIVHILSDTEDESSSGANKQSGPVREPAGDDDDE